MVYQLRGGKLPTNTSIKSLIKCSLVKDTLYFIQLTL